MASLKLYLILSLLGPALGYKILVISPAPSRSHGFLAKGIVTSLLDAGHEVTWVSPYTDWAPHKNMKLIDVSDSLEIVNDEEMARMVANNKLSSPDMSQMTDIVKNLTTLTANNQQLRQTLVNENFDAVVTEWFFSDTEAGYAAIQQVPWIMYLSMPMIPLVEGLVDDVHSVTTVPLIFTDFPSPLTLWHRVLNVAMYLGLWVTTKLNESTMAVRYESFFSDLAKARGVILPPYQEAVYNVSILFVNSHPSISPALSLPPNVIEIGGYHIDEPKPIPQEIQTIIDSSTCIIYFSMGSAFNATFLPKSLREQLIDIFEEQPCTVLWKFEAEVKGLKNIVVRKWWPQSSLLAHPKVKVFITHGGMLSSLEAVKNGVPLIALPVFGDQPGNAARAARDGYAIVIPYFSEDIASKIKMALDEMLNNDRYYKRVQFLSKIFNNRPSPPRKLVSHYVELAIESKGAYHLRSRTLNYAWYERYMVDALAILIAILFGIYAVLRRIFCRTSQKTGKIKKN